MKSNKVLLGLFVSVFTLVGGAASAQFYEIGPSNIGGQVSSLIIDHQDASRSTVYAGALNGGLFVRSSNTSVLQNIYSDLGANAPVEDLVSSRNSWHYVPCKDADGNEIAPLPISTMLQGPDGTIYIGTGSDIYPVGSKYGQMSIGGCGIYRYNSSDRVFKAIPNTMPPASSDFKAVHGLDFYQRHDTLFLFAATSAGLFRWTIGSESDWSNPAKRDLIKAGKVDNIVVARQHNMAYFSMGNQLYRMSNATDGDTAINISASNADFGGKNLAIKLAIAPSDNRYVYAMVIDSTGLMKHIYVTTNGQKWDTTTTSTILPLTSNSGLTCGTISVDPNNPKRIIVGGSNIWIGQGYVEGSNYMWTKSSYSEYELNAGDFMGSVYNSSVFVHSGIQEMVPVWNDQIQDFTYYIATDGGVFKTDTRFYSYENLNRGLNIAQISNIAVSADGSIISGAEGAGCPFIESRMDHDGGNPIISWYDYGTMGNLNHDANILWAGSGRGVAASSLQQLMPQKRRNIFVTANGTIGRSYDDYLDYTNTTTWTTGTNFVTNNYTPGVGNLLLWENDNDSYMQDSIRVTFDLRGTYTNANGQTVNINQDASIQLKHNDRATFVSKNNNDYPFTHTFTREFLNNYRTEKGHPATVGDTFLIKNPVVSRLLTTASYNNERYVIYTWMPNDFSRVWDEVTAGEADTIDVVHEAKEKMMKWAPLFTMTSTTEMPRCMAMTNDGRYLFFSTYHTTNHRSMLRRIKGFENVNFNQESKDIIKQLDGNSTDKVLTTEIFNNNSYYFTRPISSIAIDPRAGHDRVVITFEDFNSNGEPNVIIIDNATSGTWNSYTDISITGHIKIPVYSAIIEEHTGDIYVGTSEGVFIYNGTSWRQYEHLKGVSVTSIVQQTKALPTRKAQTHTGIELNKLIFAKTKWPGAIYFGTYGRGIFMDTTYVTDPENEVCDPADLAIPTVTANSENSINIYPNPVSGDAHLAISVVEGGNSALRIYDLNGRCVVNRNLGHMDEGEQLYTVSTDGLGKGMYLVNVTIGGRTAVAKMIVR